MDYTEKLFGCKSVSIYLGDTCNFNCNYCDRDYIKKEVGSQNLLNSQIPQIKNFFNQIYKESSLSIDKICFHGGEPFLYIKKIDIILENLLPIIEKNNLIILITTNGSLITENSWFLEKWKKYLVITLSYDFIFQEDNRSKIDIDEVGILCKKLDIDIFWQFVMPIQNKKVFSLDVVRDILDKMKYSKKRLITLIPLRHHRGATKFKDFFDEINLQHFSDVFVRFINILYNFNINVSVDGIYGTDEIDKKYFGDHYKIILSPDGEIYPEYDFCEYKRKEFSVGRWYDNMMPSFKPIIERKKLNENEVLDEKCLTCKNRDICGIKYLYKMFKIEPKNSCIEFYSIIRKVINYTTKIHKKSSFYEWLKD